MRNSRQLTGFVAILVGTLPLSGTPSLGGLVGARLNTDLALGTEGDVLSGTQVSSDGNWFLYLADGEVDQRFELYVGPTDLSSGPVRLNADIVGNQRIRRACFTPDSARVVYEVSVSNNADGFELYSVPPDASQAPVSISPGGISLIRDWQVAPDSSCVVLDTTGPGGAAIYVVAVDGMATPIVLTGTPSLNIAWLAQRFEISPDSSFVVFRDAELSDTFELYRVSINGGARTRLGHALVDPNAVFDFELSPDGNRVVYSGDVLTNGVTELFSAPADGSGSPAQLNGPFVSAGDIVDYDIDPTSSHVVFSADALVDEQTDLFTVPLAGGTAVQLTQHMTAGSDAVAFEFTPDGSLVLFTADMEIDNRAELYSTLIDGSQPLTKINGPLGTFRSVFTPLRISPDGSWVAYRMTLDTALVQWLLEVAPVDGSQAPVVLDTFPIRPQSDFEFLPDGARIAFRGFDGGSLIDGTMYTIRPDGTDWLTLSSPSAGFFGGVENFVLLPDSSGLFYRSDQEVDDVFQLYAAPVDASTSAVEVTGPLVAGDVEGDVFNFRISPDSLWTIYQADQDSDEVLELYSVPSDASGPPVKLNDALPSGAGVFFDFLPTGDSARVVYRADQDELGDIELYSTPIDGSGVPLGLSPPLVTGGDVESITLAPDGNTVVYTADQDVDSQSELYAVPADGSAAAVQINSALVTDGDVRDFVFTPAGDQVVYRASQDTAFEFALYVASLDGSGPGTRISGPMIAGGDVATTYACSASGRTVFLADADTDGVQEIYSAPTDGSQPPVRLNDPLPAIADVLDFGIAEDLGLVVYYADPLVDNQGDLFSVPIDGSAPPVHLNGALPANGDVAEFELTPDGNFVVYRADAVVDDRFELYSVPTAGGAAPTRLSPAIPSSSDVVGFGSGAPFAITSNGTRVIFRGDVVIDEHFELFTVPVNGAIPAARISLDSITSRDVENFTLGANNRVLYEADYDSNDVVSLYMVRAAGFGQTHRVNPLFPGFADIRLTVFATPNFQFTPDGRQVHYIADQLDNDTFELFTTRFEPPVPRDAGIRDAPGPVLDGGDRRL